MAMAVDYNGQLTPGYFGNADKYFIYESGSKGIIFLKEEINPYKDADKESEHCSVKKGRSIMEFLSGFNVSKRLSENRLILSSSVTSSEFLLRTGEP